jgi:hypothetical protein
MLYGARHVGQKCCTLQDLIESTVRRIHSRQKTCPSDEEVKYHTPQQRAKRNSPQGKETGAVKDSRQMLQVAGMVCGRMRATVVFI